MTEYYKRSIDLIRKAEYMYFVSLADFNGYIMKCVICKNGETAPGTTSILLERGATTLVFKNVPAEVCQNCGEGYMDEETTDRLLQMAEDAIRLGVQVDIRQYIAA